MNPDDQYIAGAGNSPEVWGEKTGSEEFQASRAE